MTKLTLLALALGLAVINSGCVTNQTTGKQELDPVVAQGLAQDAAFISAQVLKGQYGGELQLTLAALDTFVAVGNGDLAGLQNSLTNLPISVLKGTNGTLVASGGAILIQQLGQLVLRLDKSGTSQKYVIPIATGLRDGLRQGLAAQASIPIYRGEWRTAEYRSDRDGPVSAIAGPYVGGPATNVIW